MSPATPARDMARPPGLAVVDAPGPRVDRERAEAAVAGLLDALGIDRDSESLRDTPRRVAAAFAELLARSARPT